MVSRGFTLVAIVAMTLLAVFHQGVALKCRECNSLTNKNCSEDPASIEPTECGSSPPTTTSATTIPTTTPTTAPTAAPTTPPTTAPTAAPTTAPTAAPTTVPPTAAPTTVPPTAAPTTAPPTAAPTTAPPTAAPTAAPTTAPPTAAPTTDPTTAAPTRAPTTSSPGDGGSDDGQNGNSGKRRRRNIMVRDSASVCYKLVYKSGTDNVIERGCYAKEDACEKLKLVDGRSDAECYVCDDKDGCNASSRLSLGFVSILAPVVLLAVFRW